MSDHRRRKDRWIFLRRLDDLGNWIFGQWQVIVSFVIGIFIGCWIFYWILIIMHRP